MLGCSTTKIKINSWSVGEVAVCFGTDFIIHLGMSLYILLIGY